MNVPCFDSLHLKQRQKYSVSSFNENANFISFHDRILSGYSEINKFITQAKTYLSKNNKNTLKKTGLKATSSIRRLFVSLDIHHDKIRNTEVEKQNEPK